MTKKDLNRRSFLSLGSAVAGGAFVTGIVTGPVQAAEKTYPMPGPSHSAAKTAAPVREFRALWIASVVNIDYPKAQPRTPESLKAEFVAWLDLARDLNLNAVISQVRPTADAFWPSPYEPWSQYLTGTQGVDPGFDVLEFQVSEAHKRNLEFHGWFNPYRVSMSESTEHLVADHPAKVNEGWTFAYGGKTYYNPGIPAVRRFCEDAILHAVEHYDLDAVHFDDYFYPYAVKGKEYPDADTYVTYSDGSLPIQDWRRQNITTMVREMHERIHALKPWVKFGISPFGIWRNESSDLRGSKTSGSESYEIICADTRKWVKEGLVDYIAPQLYWNVGLTVADYAELLPWWAEVASGTGVALYIGEASYKQNSGAFKNSRELYEHVVMTRAVEAVAGQIYYNASETKAARNTWMGEIHQTHYANPALIPVIEKLGGAAPAKPRALRARTVNDGVELRWVSPGGHPATSYAIYRVSGRHFDPAELENGHNLVATVRAARSSQQQLLIEGAAKGETFTVTALDRLWNESAPAKAHTA